MLIGCNLASRLVSIAVNGTRCQMSYRLMRKKRFAEHDKLKESSFVWMMQLPLNVKLHNTARLYPRVLNDMADAWELTPSKFYSLMSSYFINNRPHPRQGFPAVVQSELYQLREYFYEEHPEFVDVWNPYQAKHI